MMTKKYSALYYHLFFAKQKSRDFQRFHQVYLCSIGKPKVMEVRRALEPTRPRTESNSIGQF